MIFDNCKPGDIITYKLGTVHSYTSIIIHLDYDNDDYSVIDIASATPTYSVPQAYVFNENPDADITDLEIIGHIDLFAPVRDQFPELFL
jgi:hypothetical protein